MTDTLAVLGSGFMLVMVQLLINEFSATDKLILKNVALNKH